MAAAGAGTRPMAASSGSSEALDVLHRAMHPESYRCIVMATKIVVDLPAFCVSSISLLATTIS